MAELREFDLLLLLKTPLRVLDLVQFGLEDDPAPITRKEKLIAVAKRFFFISSIACIVGNQVVQFFRLLGPQENLEVFIGLLTGLIMLGFSSLRTFCIWASRREYFLLLKNLKESNLDRIEPSSLQQLTRNVRTAKKVMLVRLGLIVVAVSFFCLGPIVSLVTGSADFDKIFDVWTPIKTNGVLLSILAYFGFCWTFLLQAAIGYGYDMMVLGLLLGINVKLFAFNHDLASSVEGSEGVGELVQRHINIIKLVEQVNRLFKNLIVIGFSVTSIILCNVAFLMANSESLGSSMRYALLMTLLLSYVFHVCYYGNLIESSSQEIAANVYNLPWYESKDENMKTAMKMILMRSQKSLRIEARKVLIVNLDSFKRILNTTYSYFTLLKSISGD